MRLCLNSGRRGLFGFRRGFRLRSFVRLGLPLLVQQVNYCLPHVVERIFELAKIWRELAVFFIAKRFQRSKSSRGSFEVSQSGTIETLGGGRKRLVELLSGLFPGGDGLIAGLTLLIIIAPAGHGRALARCIVRVVILKPVQAFFCEWYFPEKIVTTPHEPFLGSGTELRTTIFQLWIERVPEADLEFTQEIKAFREGCKSFLADQRLSQPDRELKIFTLAG